MKRKMPDWKARPNLRHSLVPLAWCASLGVALGAPGAPAHHSTGALPAPAATPGVGEMTYSPVQQIPL